MLLVQLPLFPQASHSFFRCCSQSTYQNYYQDGKVSLLNPVFLLKFPIFQHFLLIKKIISYNQKCNDGGASHSNSRMNPNFHFFGTFEAVFLKKICSLRSQFFFLPLSRFFTLLYYFYLLKWSFPNFFKNNYRQKLLALPSTSIDVIPLATTIISVQTWLIILNKTIG